MIDHSIESDLLLLCAVLRRFDSAMLASIVGGDIQPVADLLAGDQVEPVPGGYHLRADLAIAALAHLRAERPTEESVLHTRAFSYYLATLAQSPHSERSLDIEDECLHHLDALFILLGTQMEWRTILDYTLAVRATGVQQLRHQQRLALYEGYVGIRTQDYDRGETILSQLIEQNIIDMDVLVKALKGLADAAYYHSHYDRSLVYYQRLAIAASESGDMVYQGLALLNMGLVYSELDLFDQALDYCKRSLTIFHAQGDRVREAHARYHSALYSTYLGRWEDAREHSAGAKQLFESLGMSNYLGFVYWVHGYLQHIFGNEAASEAYYIRARPLAESPEHGQPSLALDVWLYLGFLYHTQEHWSFALDHYERALAVATQLDRKNRIYLIYFRRAQALQRLGRIDDAFAAYAQAIDGIEALGGATEGEDVKISLLGTTQQIYEAIVLLCLDLGRPADAFHYVERARSRAFLDTLVKKSPELYDALAQPVATLADVQAQLPEGALLLEYFTTGVLPSGEHMLNSIPESNARLRQHLTLPPQVIVFAIARDRCEIYRPKLNPNSLRPPIGDRYPGRHLLHGRLPQHLYDRLIAPADELLASCTMLYLVPHGPLHYVPFTALCSAAGEYLLRANGPALAHAPSATILLRNCIGRPRARGSAALAIGFNDPQGDQPLRYAEAEAQHVARILGGTAWTGIEPKGDRLIAAGRDIRWLHIAGHARFNPADPLSSDLYLGPGDPLSARAIIRDLDLAADLVTLSSCTSGVSHVVPGDELLGLQRALLYAGAPAVLCTRWEARDMVSLLVMDHFYTALQQGQPPGLALRDAQIAVRELTDQQLAELARRWDAPDSLVLDAADAAPIDLSAIRDTWRGNAPELAAALDQPAVQPSMLGSRPFADPLFWAPFMLVGRA